MKDILNGMIILLKRQIENPIYMPSEKRDVLKLLTEIKGLSIKLYNKLQRKNSKEKGSSFERFVARKLSLFLSNGERDDIAWRTQSSGATFTRRNKLGKEAANQAGDISYKHELAFRFFTKFEVEVKAYKNINLWSILDQNGEGLYEFLKQVIRDSLASKKHPMLIVKQNNKDILILIDQHIYDKMNFTIQTCPIELSIFKIFAEENYWRYFSVMKFNDFLKMELTSFNEFMDLI